MFQYFLYLAGLSAALSSHAARPGPTKLFGLVMTQGSIKHSGQRVADTIVGPGSGGLRDPAGWSTSPRLAAGGLRSDTAAVDAAEVVSERRRFTAC
mgnify:CR=1 FL=1